ncbi:hypothetical protein F4860DRAFT_522987 [Xylaria cubensis]|nr:hypothetical protein F4860DRAFT_522987 [Xylaria cubensis]
MESEGLKSGSSVATSHNDLIDDTIDGDMPTPELLRRSFVGQLEESWKRLWKLGPSPMDQDQLSLNRYPIFMTGDITYETGKRIRLMNPETNLSILLLGYAGIEPFDTPSSIYYRTHVALILAESPKLPAPGSPQVFSRIGICTWNLLPTIPEMEEIARKKGGGADHENKFLISLRKELKLHEVGSDAVTKFTAWSDQAFNNRFTIELE